MIANGLIFLLGALVALLLALLFVPLLWRNAQRLARRDYAATMPATMGEIRAEVDRVRAETALVVRRHEIQTQKAREQVAGERAAFGRLSATNAKMTFQADQHVGEANALRGQIATAEARIEALEAERQRLEEENADLRETIEEAISEARAVEAQPEAGRLASRNTDEDGTGTEVSRETQDAARVAAATSALLAIARERREGRDENPLAEPPVPDAKALIGMASQAGSRDETDEHRAIVEELRALAAAPRPSDPLERERQNGRVRERMADVAAHVIKRATFSEGAGSRTASLISSPEDPRADGQVTLAQRVRRLGESRASTSNADASTSENRVADVTAEPAVAGDPSLSARPRAKRRRGATQSRPRPPR